MAKKDKKSSKKEKQPDASDVVEKVRGAVERTFQATSGSAGPARDVGRSLLDEVASAAQRIRESFDDLRVLEDVKGLRTEIEALSKRVAALEQRQQASAAATTAAKPAAAVPKPAAAKPAAAKPAARKPAARKPAARKPRTTSSRTSTAAKPATAKPARAKPATTAKPAASKPSTSRRTSTPAKPASGS